MSQQGFKLLRMERHPDGFGVATIHSYFSQQEFVLHNRWGSWLCSNPDERRMVAAQEPIGTLAAHLQGHWRKNEARLKAYRPKQNGNIFLKKSKPNPMVAKKKANPMVAKKNNPMARRREISDRVEKANPMLNQAAANTETARILHTEQNPMIRKKSNPMAKKAKGNPMVKKVKR
jgi:hypothetical protein